MFTERIFLVESEIFVESKYCIYPTQRVSTLHNYPHPDARLRLRHNIIRRVVRVEFIQIIFYMN